ncbi:hypothetical protein CPHO_01670 [Corynebacterium phocae]|uniref:Tellurium resistance protein TerC n=1 Tax=Corynebacterium phocae TaxID=161895 RepID=A0A1L7D0Z9_9CORY|nr:hypothetical protein [Corynebacterium phocae]APT91826.1 hypothetical protein CPHO_01670 [Corynebacterium phocae]KAA8727944.1 tellurium resistance protein TerC [Corynebacterium phocae]
MTQYPPDYNRPAARKKAPISLDAWPRPLRWAYWVFVLAAIVMTVSGLVGWFDHPEPATGAWAEYFQNNRHFVAGANLVAAVIISVLAPQLSRAMKHARTGLAAVVFISCFFNIAAIAVGVGGLMLVVIVVLLLTATVLMYRPQANEFIRERNRERL